MAFSSDLNQYLKIVLTIILFLCINIIGNKSTIGYRLDLTHDRIYTLSKGTINIIDSMKEPLKITFYRSSKLFTGYPELESHGNLVRDMLYEYQALNPKMISITEIEPEPFSEQEDLAEKDGVGKISLGNGQAGYMGIVFNTQTEIKTTIPILNPKEQNSVEYDLSKAIYDLANPEIKTLGLMSGLPIMGVSRNGEAASKNRWAIYNLITNNFKTRLVSLDSEKIPDDIEVLLAIHPKGISEETQEAILGYVMQGGKLILFSDPLAETDPVTPDPSQPDVMPNLESNPVILLESLGISMGKNTVLGNKESAVQVNFSTPTGPRTISYLPWFQIRNQSISDESLITKNLEIINLGTSGYFELTNNNIEKFKYESLLTVPEKTGSLKSFEIIETRNPEELANALQPLSRNAFIALRVMRNPSSGDRTNKKPINATLFADTDMLSDRFWLRTNPGEKSRSIADNADLLVNMIDFYMGSEDLISLRSRGVIAKPFERVEKLRREVEQQFIDKQSLLKAKLDETEVRLKELQTESFQSNLFSQEEKSEIESFRKEQFRIRQELRSIQHDLYKNITTLESKIKIVNIFVIPLLIMSIGVTIGIFKPTRRLKLSGKID